LIFASVDVLNTDAPKRAKIAKSNARPEAID
jgi:hypothetical protein